MKRSEIEQLLPGIFQRTLRPGGPLDGLLDVMEDLHRPSEAALGRVEVCFDPRRAPDPFVPFLARWVDLERILEQRPASAGRPARTLPALSTGLGRLRELVAAAAYLSKWRGTAHGLQRFLHTATGEAGFVITENVDPDGRARQFHFVVRAPDSMRRHESLLHRIIRSEKPAYVTYDLEFNPPTPE